MSLRVNTNAPILRELSHEPTSARPEAPLTLVAAVDAFDRGSSGLGKLQFWVRADDQVLHRAEVSGRAPEIDRAMGRLSEDDRIAFFSRLSTPAQKYWLTRSLTPVGNYFRELARYSLVGIEMHYQSLAKGFQALPNGEQQILLQYLRRANYVESIQQWYEEMATSNDPLES